MHIKPEIGSVTGPTSDTRWGQVLTTPQAYGVLEIDDSTGRARELGISVLTKISDLLTSSPSSLVEVQTIAKNTKETGVTSLIILVPVGMVVYIVLIGEGAVYMKRGDTLACLIKREGAISGEVQTGDTLLLVSRGFTETLSEEELSGFFDHLSAKDAAEKLTLMLHEGGGGEGSAGLVFQIVNTEAVEEEEPPPRAQTIARARPWETLVLRRVRRVRSTLPQFGTRRSKLLFFITAFLFLLFGVSVILGIIKQGFGRANEEATHALTDAKHAFDEGVALLDLNPVKGRERLNQAKAILEPFTQTLSPRSKEGRDVVALYKQILDNLTQAMHTVKAEPKLFYDAGLLKKGSQVSAITITDDVVAMVDKTLATAYTLALPTKNGQIAGGGDGFSGARLVALHGGILFVFTDSGIHKIDITTKTVTPSVVKKDDSWGTISAISSFGGNLYLLDTAKGRIWKYIATDTGFSDRREYLNPDTLPDLSHATEMAIDGSVYIGTTDGKIFRFSQGKENTFIPRGIDPVLGNNLVVWTSDEVKNIYVLDKQNKRVIVLDKDGIYLAQYVWEGAIVPIQLVVSEKSGTILLLADGKIYSIDLK